MIRWREEKECYRVRISHPVEAASCVLLVPLVFVLGWVYALFVSRDGGIRGIFSAQWFFAIGGDLIVCLSLSVFAMRAAVGYLRQNALVEIALRGRRARWASGPMEPMSSWVDVARFYLADASTEVVGIDAALGDGTRRRMIGLQKMFGMARADKLVAQLNELLAAEEEPPR